MRPGKRVLGIIPARGGSKGIPGKNLTILLGKPLLQYTAAAALASSSLSDIILSTDDEKIAEAGRSFGLEVPFMRPADLAADHIPTLPVMLHAVNFLRQMGQEYDAVCLLQPTSPLRTAATIDACVTMLFNEDADAVMTVLPIPHQYNPHWAYFHSDNGTLRLATGESQPIARRQELPPAYHREGSVYVVRRTVLVDRNSLYGERLLGYPVDPNQSVNIDHVDDLLRAEEILQQREK